MGSGCCHRLAPRCLADTCEIDLADIRTIDNLVTLLCKMPFPSRRDATETEVFRVHDNGLPMYLLDLRVTCVSRAKENSLD